MRLQLSVAFLFATACGSSSAQTGTDKPIVATTTTVVDGSVTQVEVPDAAPMCAAIPIDQEKYALPPYDTKQWDAPLPQIVDGDAAMAPFYERVAELLRGKATDHIRIGVYGDSNMTMDYITGALRRMLQTKFGDGGHGYVALAMPWPWYHHMDVRHELKDTWREIATSTNGIGDAQYGFANIAAESGDNGAWANVSTAGKDAPIGTSVDKVDIYYMKRPGGGEFTIKVDGKVDHDVSTASNEVEAGFEHLDLGDGPHKVECVVKGNGKVRLYGASMERGSPSFIVDSLGTGALNYEQMVRVKDQTRVPQLAHRKYDLVVFLLGTNLFAPAYHEKWMASVFESFRTAIPNLPILVLSPPDIELHDTDTESDPRIVKLSKQLSEIAGRHQAAFWDFRQAMGGNMSMIRFARMGLAQWDLVHLKQKGGAMMGERFGHALFAGFDAYLAKHPDAGCQTAATGDR
jgi:hypothetical protein